MRVVALVALSSLVLACGGGPAPAGAPVPQGTRVRLRFARTTGRLRYEVRGGPRPAGRTLFVTEAFEDSLDAHLVRVRIDSARTGESGAVSLGPYPGFKAWFDDRRNRLDTLASDPSVEAYRAIVFDGSIPLPDGPLAAGEVWNTGPRPQVTQFHLPDSRLRASVHGVVEGLRVVDGDTVALLGITLDVKEKLTPRLGGHDVEVHGRERGEETFSVTRGITLHLALQGSLEWSTDVMEPAGLRSVSMTVHSQSERTLLP